MVINELEVLNSPLVKIKAAAAQKVSYNGKPGGRCKKISSTK
jgi:hypothetical protein